MIHIDEKSKCCGCEACVQICPLHCISLYCDKEGFRYPQVDLSKCVDCGLCEKSCPVINSEGDDLKLPLKTLACKHPDREMQLRSTSGGVVSLLSEKVIEQGGVVFGAKFNQKWEVVHDFTDTLEGLNAFRGSKYVQSQVGDCYKRVKSFLDEGKQVLFVGTSCQIRGLLLFLRKDYVNLITIDVVCHGVGSPKAWQTYLHQYFSNSKIVSIEHRNKKLGWERFGMRIIYQNSTGKICEKYEDLRRNPYLRGFIHNLFLRPSCNKCPSKSFKSGSDFTCADFWGSKQTYPDLYDKNGMSLLIVNTIHGDTFLGKLNIKTYPVDYSEALKFNPAFEVSAKKHRFKKLFFLLCGRINFRCLVLSMQIVNKLFRIAFVNPTSFFVSLLRSQDKSHQS